MILFAAVSKHVPKHCSACSSASSLVIFLYSCDGYILINFNLHVLHLSISIIIKPSSVEKLIQRGWATEILSQPSIDITDLVFENGLIYTVDKNNLWTEAIAINNGDYDIENYDLSLFNDVITINEMTIGTIAPGAYIEIEFQIDDFTENDVMMVLEISNQDHISDCIKGAEL